VDSVRLLEPVKRSDTGMVQRSQKLGLALEPLKTVAISGELLREYFDGDVAPELRVASAVDLARYSQIVFETQRNTRLFFNRSKKGSAPCGKVEKEDDDEYWMELELTPEVILTELRTVVGK
jgi:hypothetical protein